MKTKLLYVLVSDYSDIYLEQAYISMYSAKFYMPDIHITLLTDKCTSQTFTGLRKEKMKYVDELVIINLDIGYTTAQRSRILKTSARKHINGDFLFIDTDTIIVKPLCDIDGVDCSVCACWDSHSSFRSNPYRTMCLKQGHLLNWPIENETDYFNSGVIYAKDDKTAHEFYKQWNSFWLESHKMGVDMDQPAFAKANYAMGHIVNRLDDVWNCELKHGVRYLKDAKIIHYLCTNKQSGSEVFLLNNQSVLEHLKESNSLSNQVLAVIKNPFEGIATPTHVFAGHDLFVLNDLLFKYLSSLYGKREYQFWIWLVKAVFNLKCALKNIKSKFVK